MSDFVVDFSGVLDLDRIQVWMRKRPWLETAPVEQHEFPWGRAVVQARPYNRFMPLKSNGLLCHAMGWPVAVQSNGDPTPGLPLLRRIAKLHADGRLFDSYETLSGAFLLLLCDEHGATVLTDRLGILPLYLRLAKDGRPSGIGSCVEALAAGEPDNLPLDSASLAQLLVANPSYPFTSRRDIREADWASGHRFHITDGRVVHDANPLWSSREPSRFISTGEARERLATALRASMRCAEQEASDPLLMLSGGLDSRVLLAGAPDEMNLDAATFHDVENREIQCARAVAAKTGVTHHAVKRDPEFYARMLPESLKLIGCEQAADGMHYFCVLDAELEFDMLIGGIFADSLLRGHLARAGMIDAWLSTRGLKTPDPSDPWGRHRDRYVRRYSLLKPDLREALLQRDCGRAEQIAAVRPRSWPMWIDAQPLGRADQACVKASTRVMPTFEAFAHRDLIEVARLTSPFQQITQTVALPAYRDVCGDLFEAPDANTRKPPRANTASRLMIRAFKYRVLGMRPRKGGPVESHDRPGADSDPPWVRTHGSWIDWRMMQMQSPLWQSLRKRAIESEPAMETLSRIFVDDPREVLKRDPRPDDVLLNMRFVRVALHLDAILR